MISSKLNLGTKLEVFERRTIRILKGICNIIKVRSVKLEKFSYGINDAYPLNYILVSYTIYIFKSYCTGYLDYFFD